MLITFEGGEGSGKTTLINSINDWLLERGQQTVLTREPGGTLIAERIRELFNASLKEEMTSHTELLLLYAARNQHVEKVINPALKNNQLVLCDRFHDSSWIYQGFIGNIPREVLNWLDQFVLHQLTPHLTVLVDCDVEVGLKRVSQRSSLTRMDKKAVDFHIKIREGFLQRAKEHKDRFVILDSTHNDAQTLFDQLKNLMMERFKWT